MKGMHIFIIWCVIGFIGYIMFIYHELDKVLLSDIIIGIVVSFVGIIWWMIFGIVKFVELDLPEIIIFKRKRK